MNNVIKTIKGESEFEVGVKVDVLSGLVTSTTFTMATNAHSEVRSSNTPNVSGIDFIINGHDEAIMLLTSLKSSMEILHDELIMAGIPSEELNKRIYDYENSA